MEVNAILRILLSVVVLLLVWISTLLGLQAFNYSLLHTWSYIIIAPKDEDLIKDLNQAGALGWEVVSARRATSRESASTTASYELILKRPGKTESK